MRRFLSFVFPLFLAFFLVSCATQADPTDIRGIWKSEGEEVSYAFYFTPDGYYVRESRREDMETYYEIGTYRLEMDETGEGVIVTDFYDYDFVREGTRLFFDFYGEERVFTRTSRSAKYNTSASALRGVWSDGINVTGFSSKGIVITMGMSLGLDDYYTEDGDTSVIVIGGYEYPYLIINNRLFIEDDNGFLGMYTCTAMDRLKSGGNEQTSRDILVNNNPWQLIDFGGGASHYDYTFRSDSHYSMKYYSDYDPVGYSSSGTFKFHSGNIIELSDDGDLAYAIIDGIPFMFSI